MFTNIFGVYFTFAAAPAENPIWISNVINTNKSSIEQVDSVILPKHLQSGDKVTLEIINSWSTVNFTEPFDNINGDTETTVMLWLLAKINQWWINWWNKIPWVSATLSNSWGLSEIIITSSVPNISIGQLRIDRILSPIISWATTAVAQQALVSIPQDLSSNDTVYLTLNSSGIIVNWTDKIDILNNLINEIDSLSFVNAQLSWADDIIITSTTRWVSFSLSDLTIVTSNISSNELIKNVYPETQIDIYDINRTIYPWETLTADIAGTTFTGSDINDFVSKLDTTEIFWYISWSWDIIIESQNAWVPFLIWDINIQWWKVEINEIQPNRVAIAQVEKVTLPRQMVSGAWITDTLSFDISDSNSVSNTFVWNSIDDIISNINWDPWASSLVSASATGSSQTWILLTAVTRWEGFEINNADIYSQIDSINKHLNVVPVSQSNNLAFRDLVPWDEITLYVGSNIIKKSYSWSTYETLVGLLDDVIVSSVNLSWSVIGNTVSIYSTLAWVPFNLSDATLVNSMTPTVLRAPKDPVKQVNSYELKNTLVPWDEMQVTINWNTFTWSNVSELTSSITEFSTQESTSNNLVISWEPGESFSSADLITIWSRFYWNTVDSIELPREIVSWDNLSLTVSGITISQNFTANIWNELDNLKTILDLIDENIDYSFSWTNNEIVVFTWSNLLESWKLTNINSPNIIIADAWSKQEVFLPIPDYVQNWDNLSFTLSGTKFENVYTNSIATTFSNLALDWFTFDTTSSSSWIIITATETWTIFNTGPLEIDSNIDSLINTANITAEAQVDTLSLPFEPLLWDEINVSVVDSLWTTYTFSWVVWVDWTWEWIFNYLNGWLSTLTWVITSSVDINSRTFTLTSVNPGVWFTASINVNWVWIDYNTVIENTWALVRIIEYSLLSREINNGDTLTLWLTQWTGAKVFIKDFTNTKDETLSNLVEDINMYFSWTDILASYDNINSIIRIESEIPEVDFISTEINISTVYPSQTYCDSNPVKCHINVYSVAQVDYITFPRSLIIWDTVSFNFSWSTLSGGNIGFTWTISDSINWVINYINNSTSLTWVVLASQSLIPNTIEVTSTNPWIPFEISNIVLTNTPAFDENYVPNITPIYPVANIDFGTYGNWDIINVDFNFDDNDFNPPYFTWFTWSISWTDANSILVNIQTNFSGAFDSELNWNILTLTWLQDTNLHIDTSVTNISNINSVPSFIPAEAQIEELALSTASWSTEVIADWTLWIDISTSWWNYSFSYDTQSWDTLDNVTDNFFQMISLSWAITSEWIIIWWSGWVLVTKAVSSTWVTLWLNTLTFTAVTPWIGFNVTPTIRDLKNPIVSWPDQTIQTLRSGSWLTITGSVTSNEPWTMYLVQNWVTLDSASLTNAQNNNQASIIAFTDSPTLVNIQWSIIVPLLEDWLYNVVAKDKWDNVSNAFTWFLIIDNTAPVLNVVAAGTTYNTSSAFMINSDNITFTGNWEIWSTLTINWNLVNLDTAWAFTGTYVLIQDSTNVFDFVSTDIAGNQTNLTLTVIEKSTAPNLTISNLDYSLTNQITYTITGTTDSWVGINIFDSNNVLRWSSNSTQSWTYSVAVNLTPDIINSLIVIATDWAWNNANSNIHVIQDSTAPNIVIYTQSWTITSNNNIIINWRTEANIQVNIWTLTLTSDLNWNFSQNVLLNSWSNIINVSWTDLAWNIWTASIQIIYQAPNPILNINTPPTITNSNTITISGSTNPNSLVTISWGSGTLVSANANGSWSFSMNIPLTLDTINILTVISNYSSGLFITDSVTITQDSTVPSNTVWSSNGVTSNLIYTLTGSTEPNSIIVVTWWSWTFTTVADSSWYYIVNIELNPDSINTLVITSTDQANNTSSTTFIINHTSDPFFLIVNITSPITTSWSTISVGWAATPWYLLSFIGNTNSWTINSVDPSWSYLFNNITLSEWANTIKLTLDNGSGSTISKSFTVNRDSTGPIISLSTTSKTTYSSSIVIEWTLNESNVSILITWWNWIASFNTNTSSNFSVPVNLNIWVNNLVIWATDSLGNMSFKNLIITYSTNSGWGGGWGGWGVSLHIDYCPNWDYSTSYYDNNCGSSNWNSGSNWNSNNNGNWTINPTSTNLNQLASKYILLIKKTYYEKAPSINQKIIVWEKIIEFIEKKLQDSKISQNKIDLLKVVNSKAKAVLESLIKEKWETIDTIDKDTEVDDYADKDTLVKEDKLDEFINKYIPVKEFKMNETWIEVNYVKYIEVDHSVVVRDYPSYKWNIVDYLPRNYEVVVIAKNNLWSKIKYMNDKIAFIRNTYLRNQNKWDKWRTASINVFYDISLQSDVDMRKIKVARSVNVRRWPGLDYDKKDILHDWDNVLILDEKSINWFYEIRTIRWNGWVSGKYIK